MKKYTVQLLFILLLITGISSCKISAPRFDYKALAHASIKLGIEIDMEDNHKLYIQSASWIGTPYRSGGNTKRGVDCSGFTTNIYRDVYNIKLQRTTGGQMSQTKKVSKSKLREGDLLFFSSRNSKKKVAHVGIYLKNNKFVHASSSRGVIVSHLNEQYYRTHWIRGGRIR